jgi:N-methylhydantoinase A
VTDANALLGRLNADSLLAGRMRLDLAAAGRAVTEGVARPLGIDAIEAALGMIRVVNANMARAVRVVTVEKGHDPRDFVLVGFGGAGPMHAAQVASELEIPRVLIPASPGILCALGLLLADVRADFGRTALMSLHGADPRRIETIFGELAAEATVWLEREGLDPRSAELGRSLDARYVGQEYELRVPIGPAAFTDSDLAGFADRFHSAHERAYGYASPGVPVQLVSFRIVARSAVPRPVLVRRPAGGSSRGPTARDLRKVYFEDANDFVPCPVYDRDGLMTGHRVDGPAIVEQMDTTIVIPPGHTAEIDEFGNIIVDTGARRASTAARDPQ